MPSEVITEKEIKNKIGKALEKGFTIKQIKESLSSQGWPEQEITKFIFDIKEKKLKDNLLIKPKNVLSTTKIEQDIKKIEQYPKIKDEEKIILKPLERPKLEIRKPVQELKIEKPIIPEFIKKGAERVYPRREERLPKTEKLPFPKVGYEKERLISPPQLKWKKDFKTKFREEKDFLKKAERSKELQFKDKIASLEEERVSLKKAERSKELQFKDKIASLEKEKTAFFNELADIKKEKKQIEDKLGSEIDRLKDSEAKLMGKITPLKKAERSKELEFKDKIASLEEERVSLFKELATLGRSKKEIGASLKNKIDEIVKQKAQTENRLNAEISRLKDSEAKLMGKITPLKKAERSKELEFKDKIASLEEEKTALFNELADIKKEKKQIEDKLGSEIASLSAIKESPEIQPSKQIPILEEEKQSHAEKTPPLGEIKDFEKKIEIPKVKLGTENQKDIKSCMADLQKIKKEIARVIVGQERVINSLLKALLSNGHVLVEGVPGIAKTLIIRVLAKVTGCKFKRIQFTVDLLPTDIVGFISYSKQKGFYTVKGPIFANFIIADEINRATPKSQSALLEAMQEKQITIGKNTFSLPRPFFVMANKNPIEAAGVYPLPEAQRDRFLFKTLISYPTTEEEKIILKQNISLKIFEDFGIKSIINSSRLIQMQEITKKIYLDPEIEKYIVEITNATRQPSKYKIELGKYIDYGASPRASIGMFIASKADALLNGKSFVNPQNVKNVAYEILCHRILLNYEAIAEKVKEEQIIDEILSKVPVP